jgi:AcrR family transcriptional regulator
VSTDGRVARGERTRAAIVAALLDLLSDGEPRPTAREIAERAGVSVRSIFQHFEDLETLRRDVVELQTRRLRPVVEDLPSGGDRAARIHALARHRRRLYEQIAPLRRSMAGLERTAAIERGLGDLHRRLRTQVTEQFAEELDGLAAPGAAPVVAALDALTSFEAWEQLRNVQRLGPAAAETALRVALDRLVPASVDGS